MTTTQYRPFNEARDYARNLGLPNKRAWYQYCKSGKKRDDIPSHPERRYKAEGWIKKKEKEPL